MNHSNKIIILLGIALSVLVLTYALYENETPPVTSSISPNYDAKRIIERQKRIKESALLLERSKFLPDKQYREVVAGLSIKTGKILAVQEAITKKMEAYYGKIVDQYGHPVPNAIIEARLYYYPVVPNSNLSWSKKELSTVTDANGIFVFEDIEGVKLSIKSISKDGYIFDENIVRHVLSFDQMTDEKIKSYSDKSNIKVYKAWKREMTTGRKLEKIRHKYVLESLEKYYTIDLVTGKIKEGKGGQGIIVLAYKDPNYSTQKSFSATKPAWNLKLTITDGGGLIDVGESFQYLAPESGYSPEMTIGYADKEEEWRSTLEKNLFIYMKKREIYGNLKIIVRPFHGTKNDKFEITLNYGFNKFGERILEP